MTVLGTIIDGISRWIDSVAATIVAVLGWFASPRAVQLVEEKSGAFVLTGNVPEKSNSPLKRVQIADGRIVGSVPDGLAAMLRGSRVEVILQPARFLFRPLELPKRAAEFLDGIVRAQIDRLTPWSASDAAFGWSKPAEAGADRMAVTVAATSRMLIAPYVRAIAPFGAGSITVSTFLEDQGAGPVRINVLDEKWRTALDVGRVRRALLIVLVVTGLAAVATSTAAGVVGANLQARQDQIARQIANRRAATLAGREGSLDAATASLRMIERRKHESPSSVVVLDQLSQVLPDHTYVTELRIEGDKLRLVGVTRDAPSLIGLIEQTSHFSRATFFAPTTRSPTDPGERFHIEARIEPVFLPRS